MAAADKILALSEHGDSSFIDDWRREFEEDKNRDSVDRTEAEDDHQFVYSSDLTVKNQNGVGSQWSSEAWQARKSRNAPILQWNRMHTYQQHVVNMGRQNDFAIQVTQADGGQPETTEYYAGRIRHIEYESNASTVWDIARENQCSSGRGFVKIGTRYRRGSFQQVPVLEEIPNQFSIIWGPHREQDCSDADRCWEIFYLTKAQFKRQYPNAVLTTTDFAPDEAPRLSEWINTGKDGQQIQVAKKYQKEYSKVTIYKLVDGSGVREDQLTGDEALAFSEDGQPITRVEDTCKVMVYTFDGVEILDTEEFIVDEIPIIPVWGLTSVVDGIQRHYSLGNRAKQAQRLVNLYVSNIALIIANQGKAKISAQIGSIEKQHEGDWAGTTNAAIQFWNAYDEDGRSLSEPQALNDEPPIQALSIGLQQALEAMKAAHGIYDASIGARSNETSGLAIKNRQEQAEIINYHFTGNEARAHKRAGQILVKMIYTLDHKAGSKRTIRAYDGEESVVTIGEDYTLSDVELGINVDMGPSYKSQMDQIHETDANLIANLPPEIAIPLVPEFLATQNAPNKKQRVQIAKNAVNKLMPGVLPPDEDEEQQLPPQVAQMMQQVTKERDDAIAFAQQQFEENKSKMADLENKWNIAKLDSDTRLKIAEIQNQTKNREITVDAATTMAKEEAIDDRTVLEHSLSAATEDEQRRNAVEDREETRKDSVEDAKESRKHELELERERQKGKKD